MKRNDSRQRSYCYGNARSQRLFVKLLSDVRQNEERTINILKEINEAVEDPDIKEAIESRIFLKDQTLSTLDRCFKLIGERPQKSSGRIQDVFVEDFRRELDQIKGALAGPCSSRPKSTI